MLSKSILNLIESWGQGRKGSTDVLAYFEPVGSCALECLMSCNLNKMALGKLVGRGAGWAEGGVFGCLVMSTCVGFPWGLGFSQADGSPWPHEWWWWRCLFDQNLQKSFREDLLCWESDGWTEPTKCGSLKMELGKGIISLNFCAV